MAPGMGLFHLSYGPGSEQFYHLPDPFGAVAHVSHLRRDTRFFRDFG
jgi:hypothetical protein